MMKPRQSVQLGSHSSLRGRLPVLAVILTLSILSISMAEGQTFTVLHQFTGGGDGAGPAAGVTIDQGGNLYGTSAGESINGAGNVYELKRLANGGYTLVVLHDFQPTLGDGGHPLGRVIFGPDGRLYGMTSEGANNGCLGGFGCGMVFALQPPATFCSAISCAWHETILHIFTGNADGGAPGYTEPVFDRNGNLYGTTQYGGTGPTPQGTVFMLQPSGGGWAETVLFNFQCPGSPDSAVLLDNAGNLYGTTADTCDDDHDQGSVYQLTKVGNTWSANFLRIFQGGSDGSGPTAALVSDSSGNLYGSTTGGGLGRSGTLFEFSRAGNGWNYSQIYGNFIGSGGPWAALVMDSAGNLYGTTSRDGVYQHGSVFKLSPVAGGWSFSTLHDFTGGDDGSAIYGGVTLDSAGNLYGTASEGGAFNSGVVWKIVP